MNENSLKKWEKTRAMGRSAFVVKYGVLGWGITTGILWSLLVAATEGLDSLPALMITGLIMFPAGGYFFGRFLWAQQERAREKSLPVE